MSAMVVQREWEWMDGSLWAFHRGSRVRLVWWVSLSLRKKRPDVEQATSVSGDSRVEMPMHILAIDI